MSDSDSLSDSDSIVWYTFVLDSGTDSEEILPDCEIKLQMMIRVEILSMN